MSATSSPSGRGDPGSAPILLTLGTIGSSDGSLDDQHQLVTLLAYLAHNGPTDRQRLATVFWPRARKPLNNLSSALSRIRRISGDLVGADRHRVSTTCTTDAHALLESVRDGSHQAAAEYPGLFLDGFAMKNVGIELEEWIFDVRESIAAAVVAALTDQSAQALAAGESTRAADLAERALAAGADVIDLNDHLRDLHRALAASNRPSAIKVRSLAHDAGIDLTVQASAPARHTDDSKPTIWGRKDDLARLAHVVRPGSVANLFGLGGIGKSVLARHLLTLPSLRARFPGGIHLVELHGESDGERAMAAVLEALDLAASVDTNLRGLSDAIDAPSLVVLDDVRASDADTTPSMTTALSNLTGHESLGVLALSRLRIESDHIQPVPLRGLAVGATDADSSPAVAYFTECAGSDAVERTGERLFAAHAFRICQQLSGMPLALELTAAWLRLLPTSEVLSILDDDEILNEAPPGEDVSLSHVIEQSWDLLPSSAKAALGSLAVMRGGFDRRAAREVTGIGIRDLSELHDHSLIEIDAHGLMRCHPLIQAFAKRKLHADTDRQSELEQRHRAWFMRHLADTMNSPDASASGDQMEALARVQDNLEAAWASMVHAGEWTQLSESLGALDQFLLRSGRVYRAERMYRFALDELQANADPTTAGILAAVANNLAWVQMLLADPEGAAAMCQVGLDALPDDDVSTHIALLRTQCALLGNAGDPEAALNGYRQARELAAELDDTPLRALLDEDIGRSHATLGQHDQAIEAFRRTLDSGRLLGDPHMEARSYLMIGLSKMPTDPAHSLVLFDQGERLAEASGLAHLLAYFPCDRARTLMALGDYDAAISEYQRSIIMGDETGDHVLRAYSTLELAQAQLKLGDLAASAASATEGLRLAIRGQLWSPTLGVGLAIAAHQLQRDPEHERARHLANFSLKHPNLARSDQVAFEQTITTPLTATEEIPADARLDEICELILQLFHT